MRKRGFAIPLILTFFCLVLFSGNLFSNTEVQEVSVPTWKISNLSDVEIMQIKKDQFSFSQIETVLLGNRLESGALPLTGKVIVSASAPVRGICRAQLRILQDDTTFEGELSDITMLSDTAFSANLQINAASAFDGGNKEQILCALQRLDGTSSKYMIKTTFADERADNSGWLEVK